MDQRVQATLEGTPPTVRSLGRKLSDRDRIDMRRTQVNQLQRKAEIRRDMERAREKTLRLLQFVPDDLLKVRVHDFYSPIGWHFGHVGMTEELWTVREAM